VHAKDLRVALLVALVSFLVYNANLRLIGAGDSYPARFLPFALWSDATLYLDPVLDLTIQGHPNPYWVRDARNGHKASMYAVATPVLVAPLYLPAIAYLSIRGWTEARVNQLAFAMEKIAASVVASLAAGWMYLLLRRRLAPRLALPLTLLFAFGTSTWVISSQALWQHGPAELCVVAALWFLTAEPTPWNAWAAGLATGLVAATRPPDLMLSLAFGAAALLWAERSFSRSSFTRFALFAAGAAIPLALTLAYNLTVFGKLTGGYGQAGVATHKPTLENVAGLLISPARGLFVFSPFLLFLPLFFHRALRDRTHRSLTLLLAGGFVLLVLISGGIDFRQGFVYGPRFLADALPILIWMLAPIVPTLGSLARAFFLAAGVFSVWVQCVGAFQYTGTSNIKLVEIESGPEATRAAWRWRNAPFLLEARNPRAPATVFHALRSLGDPPPPPQRAPLVLAVPPGAPSLSLSLPVETPRTGPASDFYTLTPCRLVDTSSGPPLAGGTPRIFRIAGGGCSIPGAAVAVVGSLTVWGATGSGVLRLQPDRGRLEVVFSPGAPRSLDVILTLAPDGSLAAVAESVAGPAGAHLQIDVSGYFAPNEERYDPSSPKEEAR
jgi:hypothetical protein